MKKLRWALKFTAWNPTCDQWLLAARCIQQEERDRISAFMFQRDAKSAMVGRLFIRNAITMSTHLNNRDIMLGRTKKNKPFLKNKMDTEFSFNVSHQGDYTVLACDASDSVGVDVMKTEIPRGTKSISEYFHLMRRQFSHKEWCQIKSNPNEFSQLACFYRFWCLKESYVKAVGVGISFSLDRLEFLVKTPLSSPLDRPIHDTLLYVDGDLCSEWKFEENMIDCEHYVTVCSRSDYCGDSKFIMKLPDEILADLSPLEEVDRKYWTVFEQKPNTPN